MKLTDNQEKKYNQIIEKLKSKNIRMTEIRSAVIKSIIKSKDHVTTQDIVKELEAKFDNVNLMSVYNTLDLLLENHILFANTFNGKSICYEIAAERSMHIKCDKCGQVDHVEDAIMDKFDFVEISKISDLLGMSLEHFKIEAHGLCKKCKKCES
ncbi:Fur family transcriptional regulator [[Acholeplasma] multilocale]|uniref:Fur family transcriptional regulator n=1 Tax=[Acholeplasma] multilocale TaxID=264638 RepID=UPI0003FC4F9C|nr:Fur family transcriptional regulator [[Acholeplasma] multilocale]